MSGGGGSSKSKASTNTGSSGGSGSSSLPAYARAPQAMTFQPHLPGMQGMLAEQLAAGFGGDQSSLVQMLSGMYQPMTVQRFFEPISTTAALYDKSKNKPISTGNAALDKLLMGGTIGTEEKK